MRKNERLLLIMIFIYLATINVFLKAETINHIKDKKNILIINSYHNGFSWTDSLMSGINSVFNKNKYTRQIFTEYLDTKRYNSKKHEDQLYSLFKIKYKNTQYPPDIIITADDNAYNFIKLYKDSLFKNVPIVFCGINYLSKDSIKTLKQTTGILETSNFKENINIIKTNHPNIKHLALIIESSTTGKQYKKEFGESFKKQSLDSIKIHYYENLDLFTLIENLKNLPKNSVALLTPFMKDVHNNFYEAKESAKYITNQLSIPVYSTHKLNLGAGIVGGCLISAFLQGKQTALLTEKILNHPSQKLPDIIIGTTERYFFDNKILKKFNINKKKLPLKSMIINCDNYNFLLTVNAVMVFIITITILSFVVLFLVFSVRKRKKAEDSLNKLQDKLAEIIKKRTQNLNETNLKLKQEIKKKQKVENKLLSNIEYTKTILNNLPDIVFIFNKDGVYLDIITSTKHLLYQKEQILLGSNICNILPKFIAEKMQNAINLALENNTTQLIDYPLNMNKEYWFEARIVPIANYKNNENAVVVLVLDVTERKKLELSLIRIRKALNSSGDGIIVFDLDGKISFANHAVTKMIKYNGKTEQSVSDFSDTFIDKQKAYKILKNVEKGKSWSGEVILRTYNENEAEFLLRTDAIIDDDEHLLGYIATFSDLTKQKDQERLILSQLKYIEDLIESVPLPIFIKDYNGIIKIANEEFCKILGKRKTEIIDKSLVELLPNGSSQIYLNGEQKLRFFRKNQILESKIRDHTNKKINLIIHLSLLNNGDINKEDTVTIFTDITEQKKIEANLKIAISKSKTASEEKSRFLANMSHEIRTPMNGVIGLANLLKDTKLNKVQNEYINLISYSATSLLEIINSILDLSKIESGKIELEESVFDLKKLIDSIYKLLKINATNKNINLICNYRNKLPLYLKGDEIRIRQIIINVLNNAIKFTNKGFVEINITSKEISKKNILLEFEINDTGIGISEDKLKTIFDSFIQADSSTTRKYGGTGLGLSISKMLLKLMNGNIKAFKREPEGSTFLVTIPLFIPNSDELLHESICDKENLQNKQLPQMKALIAEDNYISRKLIASVLQKNNQLTTTVENGIEVLNKYNYENFDYIVMDGQMPEMDGFEATVKLRKQEENSCNHIPIIALTASAIQGEEQKFYNAGMDYYLTKPLDEKKLIDILKIISRFNKLDIKNVSTKINQNQEKIRNKYRFLDIDEFNDKYNFLETKDIKDIIKEYLQNFNDSIKSLPKTYKEHNWNTFDSITHTLKGTSATLYLHEITNIFSEMNIKVRKKEFDKLETLLKKLLKIAPSFNKEIELLLMSLE